MNTRFYFGTCQVGAEKAAKAEVLKEFPYLRFAFSRPGFITYKEEPADHPVIESVSSVFTRLWGNVLGQAKGVDGLQDLVDEIPVQAIAHVFDRDLHVPGDEPPGFVIDARMQTIVDSLKNPRKKEIKWNALPKNGDTVFDLIGVDDEHFFFGEHTHRDSLDPHPGNRPAIELPTESPSRAYLKIEEAIARFKPVVNPGMSVLEVGCSPGGATLAMLSRKLEVTGVDPKEMAPILNGKSGFKFIQKLAKSVNREDLKAVNPDWLVMDMNIAPVEALEELAHVVSVLKKHYGQELKLKQGFLTLKLNDWKLAEQIPQYLHRLDAIGFKGLAATQLCTNRQEFFVYASNFKA